MIEAHEATEPILGAAFEVHRALGPGPLESVYERCLCRELELRGIAFERQVALPVLYKDRHIDCDLRIDIVVERQVKVDAKSAESLLPIHTAQLLTYLKLSGIRFGLLMKFNVPLLRDGLKRVIL